MSYHWLEHQSNQIILRITQILEVKSLADSWPFHLAAFDPELSVAIGSHRTGAAVQPRVASGCAANFRGWRLRNWALLPSAPPLPFQV